MNNTIQLEVGGVGTTEIETSAYIEMLKTKIKDLKKENKKLKHDARTKCETCSVTALKASVQSAAANIVSGIRKVVMEADIKPSALFGNGTKTNENDFILDEKYIKDLQKAVNEGAKIREEMLKNFPSITPSFSFADAMKESKEKQQAEELNKSINEVLKKIRHNENEKLEEFLKKAYPEKKDKIDIKGNTPIKRISWEEFQKALQPEQHETIQNEPTPEPLKPEQVRIYPKKGTRYVIGKLQNHYALAYNTCSGMSLPYAIMYYKTKQEAVDTIVKLKQIERD